MAILETLKGVDLFLNVLKKITGMNKELEEHQKELIIALGNAARNTKIAIHKLREGTDSSFDLETTIAQQWVEAVALLKNDDQKLALRLYQKGQAWTEAKEWKPEDFKIANQNIDLVDKFVTDILSNK
jgi:hypothetical protein